MTIGSSAIQKLSGVELAICAKHKMNPSVMVKVVCPKCGEGSLVNKQTHLKTGAVKKWWQFWK